MVSPRDGLLVAGTEGQNRGCYSGARGTVTACRSVDEPEAPEKGAASVWAPLYLSATSTLGSQPTDTVQLGFDQRGDLEARDCVMLSQVGKLFLILSYRTHWKRRQRKRQTER